jgi:hypothetical protein
MASALTSTATNRDPVTYTEAVESPQQDTEGRLWGGVYIHPSEQHLRGELREAL